MKSKLLFTLLLLSGTLLATGQVFADSTPAATPAAAPATGAPAAADTGSTAKSKKHKKKAAAPAVKPKTDIESHQSFH